MKVWVADASSDNASEEHTVGLYTSRRKAKRAVLDFHGLARGRWEKPTEGSTYEPLDRHWLVEVTGDGNASGSVMQQVVR